MEIAWGSAKKLNSTWKQLKNLLPFLSYPEGRENWQLNFNNTKDFLFLPELFSAKNHIYKETVSLAVVTVAGFVALLYLLSFATGLPKLTIFSGLIALFYLSLMVFKLFVVYHALRNHAITVISDEEVRELKDEDLPVYTILIPLYREEKVINQIVKSMTAIDYPAEKLDIIITLEAYDHWTIDAIKEANVPAHFKTLILPDVQPKTKPKAMNIAFLQAKGEFLVIYDAEIMPDPDQLKKAVIAFRKKPEIACFQTQLDHYNTYQSLITRLFNAEFSFYYDLYLPGLQKLGLPIPLSGHSTHFRRSAIEKMGAWDPYNVTEDCDVGMRLYRAGFRTGIINSTAKEEATDTLKSWVMQRTRWMKGFIQTSIVHLRYPLQFKEEIGGWGNFLAFLLIVPGTVVVNIFNLLYWIMLVAWFLTRAEIIQTFFPTPILYLSVTTFILGNIIFTYLNLLGVYGRGRFSLVKYSALSPIYWIMLAIATVRAAIQIVTKPHHWEKTTHGTHLAK